MVTVSVSVKKQFDKQARFSSDYFLNFQIANAPPSVDQTSPVMPDASAIALARRTPARNAAKPEVAKSS